MLTISLKNIEFFAYHGVYESEKLLGNRFILNMHVHFLPTVTPIARLEETLNYEVLFKRVSDRMAQPTPLLETIVMELAEEVLASFLQINAVFVSLEKCNPPIAGLVGSVEVAYQAQREN